MATAPSWQSRQQAIAIAQGWLQRLEQGFAEQEEARTHLRCLVDSDKEGSETIAQMSEAVDAAACVLHVADPGADEVRRVHVGFRGTW